MGHVSLYLRLWGSGVSTHSAFGKEQGIYIPKLGLARLSQINRMIICWPGEPNCQCYDQFVQALPKRLLVIPLEVWGYPRNFLFTLRSLLMGRYRDDPAAGAAPVL